MIWKWNEHFQCLNVLLASVTFKIIPVLISEGTYCLLTAAHCLSPVQVHSLCCVQAAVLIQMSKCTG